MIVRVGLLVAASVAAFAAKQLNEKNSGFSKSKRRRSGMLPYEFQYDFSFPLFNDPNEAIQIGLSLLFI